jgi:hypothetical protein
MGDDPSVSEFDALQSDDVLELLVQYIAQLSPTQKTVLALYYHEDLEPIEIAACLGLTECQIDQIRDETVELLQSMLASQIRLASLPETYPSVRTLEAEPRPGWVGDEPILQPPRNVASEVTSAPPCTQAPC